MTVANQTISNYVSCFIVAQLSPLLTPDDPYVLVTLYALPDAEYSTLQWDRWVIPTSERGSRQVIITFGAPGQHK